MTHTTARWPLGSLSAVIGFSLVLLAMIWLAVVYEIREDREQVQDAVETQNANLARVFEEHVLRTISGIDMALLHLRERYENAPLQFAGAVDGLRLPKGSDLILQVSIVDSDGNLLFSDLGVPQVPLNIQDREHFRVHKEGQDDALFISKPVLGRFSGKWSLQFTRRLRSETGQFAGVIVLSVEPRYFTAFYESINIGAEGAIALLGQDQVIRARASRLAPPQEPLGRTIPLTQPSLDPAQPLAGSYQTTSPVDGLRRLVSYRRLKDYPLVVVVSASAHEVFAPLQERVQAYQLAGGVISIAIMLFAAMVIQLSRRQHQARCHLLAAQAALRENEERWRLALEGVGDGVWDWDIASGRVFFSSRWKAMLGCSDTDIAPALEAWQSRIHPDDRNDALSAMGNHLQGQTAAYRSEHRLLCADGQYRWFLNRAVVLSRTASGQPLRLIGTQTDITERRNLEEQSRQLSVAVEQSPVSVIITDNQGRIEYANARFQQVTGYSLDDVRGETPRLLKSGEIPESTYTALWSRITSGQEWRGEFHNRRKDGSLFWEAASISPLRDKRGEITHFIAIKEDITARKADEARLQESEARFRSLADCAPVLIWMAGLDTLCFYFNRTWLDFTGRTLEQETGNGWTEGVHPDDVNRCLEIYTNHFNRRQAFQMEYRLRRHDGMFRWILDTGSPRHAEDGTFLGFIGSCLDITELRESVNALHYTRQRLEQVLESAGEGIIGLDGSGRISFANSTAATLLERTVDDLIHHEAHAILHTNPQTGETLPEISCPILITLNQSEGQRTIRSLFWTRSGHGLPVECVITPMPDRQGAVVVFRNITERLRWEDTLARQASELRQSNGELEAFAYIASHDLREPLRMVSNYMSLLERRYKDQLDAPGREYIAFARDGAKRMNALIIDLLEYSRIGRRERPFEPVALGPILATVLADLALAITETGARMTVMDDLPTVTGDSGELTRLFQNLLGNALKYRDRIRTPEVTVSWRSEDKEWLLTIADNGIGIAPEYFDTIFGIFQRLHSRQDYEGTGIGLAVCRKIVLHHGGRIWVESTPGLGSTFFIALPKVFIPRHAAPLRVEAGIPGVG